MQQLWLKNGWVCGTIGCKKLAQGTAGSGRLLVDTGGISFQSIVEGGQVRVREEGGFGSKLAYLDPLDGKMLCRWAMGLGAAMRQRGGGSIEGEAVAARVYAFSQQHIF
jgi:hypothetical protein